MPGVYDDWEEADLVVLVGTNLAWCHPVLFQRLLAVKAKRPEMRFVLGNDTVIGAVAGSTDSTADILSGGYGDDLVIGDNGDTMTGGEGADDFGVGFDFGAGSAPVTITDLVAATESITIGVSADMSLASMDWSVTFDPASGVATIDIWGAEDTGSGPTLLPAETAIVLQNMTAADVANISIAFTA